MFKLIITIIVLITIYSIYSMFDDWIYDKELYKNSGLEKKNYWKE